jgi:hypothetical protein
MEDKIENNDSVEQIEETAAADTLKPNGGSVAGDTKTVMLSTFVQLLSQLGKEDLSDLFNQVQDQYGPNKTPGAIDNSAANKASLAPNSKPVKEAVEEIFEGEDLSEDFMEKAEVIFEAVLNSRYALIETELREAYEAKETELQEAFDAKLEEEATEIFDALAEQINQYMNHIVEEWMEENQVAIDNGLRADIAEGFIEGLQNLFAEHYINVPEERFDIMAEMKDSIESLEAKLNESFERNAELEEFVAEVKRERIIDDLSEGLTMTEADKLRNLSEGLEYTDAEGFTKKVSLIKERIFSSKNSGTGMLTEDNTSEPEVPTSVNKYVDAISKSVKK